MVSKILPFLSADHRIYVEPFGGGASVLFAKEPSALEVYNDLDLGLVNLFRVLRDLEKFTRFYHYASFTPYAREEWKSSKDWADYTDDVVRAYKWFVLTRQSFSGLRNSWSRVVSAGDRGITKTCSSWLSTLEMLPEIHYRLMRVQIENKDFRDILKDYDTAETLFYCDPPYVPETRREGGYNHELSMDDHQELVEILLGLQGKVVLSGYNHKVYEPLEKAGWQRTDFETYCTATGRTKATRKIPKEQLKRVESVWVKV